MTGNPDNIPDSRHRYAEALVPLLAFGTTLAGIMLWQAGVRFEVQYAAAGGFFASCLLACIAWLRPRKDIVSLSTPIYGFLFLATPIDYAGGITLQLLYAIGLTALVIRLHYRFAPGIPGGSSGLDLPEPLKTYVGSIQDAFTGLGPAPGHSAAEAFFWFSGGEYRKAAEVSHAAVSRDGTFGPMARAFRILCQHADLLDKNLPRPKTFLTFLPDDAALLARPLPAAGDPDREFEVQLDNALLLLYSAAWHVSPADRPSLLALQGFAGKLLEA
jgi:hypothetical protein